MWHRCPQNPILAPTSNEWECSAVCNPAAVLWQDQIYLLYRAINSQGISCFGLARSPDGLHFSYRSPQPVLEPDPQDPYQKIGIEDPRAVVLEGQIYVTFTMASLYPRRPPTPWDAGTPWRVRPGLFWTSDFQHFSPFQRILRHRDSKNAVLFPQKIKGRYYLLHRPYPDIWIATSKDLLHWYFHRPLLRPREGRWDSDRVGAGPPPVLSPVGWLLFYHGTEKVRNRRTYRVGLAVLDREDPRQVLGRSSDPLMEPTEDYEAPFLSGNTEIYVVFPTGLVEWGDQYLLYYGAGDKYVALAWAKKEEIWDYAEGLISKAGEKRRLPR